MEETQPANKIGRQQLADWQKMAAQNPCSSDPDFMHSIAFYFGSQASSLHSELQTFGEKVVRRLEPLVIENNLYANLPRIEHFDGIGRKIENIIHHPSYEAAGNIIYSSRLLERMAKPGGLAEGLAFMFLSSQAGEAGHNCPIACSAGIIRVLQKVGDFPKKDIYIKKLTAPSYTENFTGAQFLTEIQGGSDVGLNAVEAYREGNSWRIRGEKWFCSNANAELILMTARFDSTLPGTKGLGLFLVPACLESGERNAYTMRRLKDKIGTRSMASAEMDFHGASAIPVGPPEEGFKMVMENVLHISRLFNTFCVLGMARRAYHIALSYARHRIAFGRPIIEYPLVLENLARIKAENSALLSSIFSATQLQDEFDKGHIEGEEAKLLLRLLANLNKYLSALWSVEHIHHALDTLAGNGAIENFSTIPRLLRDCIVCENWEGTHNTLRMQILKDIGKFHIDEIFLRHLDSLLEKIERESPWRQPIQRGIERLVKDLERLKQASKALQSLLIKGIADQMAILFAALNLLQEGLSQSASGADSKIHCLEYFIRLHLSPEKQDYDEPFLQLIQAIVEDRYN